MNSLKLLTSRIRWSGIVLALVAASFWPLHIVAVNLDSIVRPERVIGIVLVAWLVGLVMIIGLTALGLEVEAAENTAFLTVAVMMNAAVILRAFGTPLGWLIMMTGLAIAGWLLVRFHGHFITSAVVWGAAVALAAGPILSLIQGWEGRSGASVVEPSEPLEVELLDTPDIFLVVLDGYPGAIAAQQDGLGNGVVDVVGELRDRGFEVPESTWSSYWATSLSIPSLLQMGYPVKEERWTAGETQNDLNRVLSGDNALVETLLKHRYRTHMIEAGWSVSSCGVNYDVCVPSPLLDEATSLILRRTAAWTFLDESPGPYVLGTLAAFDWLEENAGGLSGSPRPDFVFSHVVSPHAPFFLQPDCTPEYHTERAGTVFKVDGVSEDTRARYLTEQMDCLDRLMIDIADTVDRHDIVIFVSDHGSDRRDQSDPAMVEWNREATVERFNNFLAVRLPEGCSTGERVIVPNVLRGVLDCLTEAPVPRVPERMWVNPMRELDRGVVDELLDMSVAYESLEN
jgi:hypothetical protein